MISIVIPIFNEEENIAVLQSRLTAASPTWHDTYEIILVDDGSVDSSASKMKEIARKDSHFKIVKLSRNLIFKSGFHNAFVTPLPAHL